jgi:hypothetical protein
MPSGKAAPIDPDPCARGNVRVTWNGPHASALALPKAELAKAREVGEPLYLSHFATCPQAKRFRDTAR